MIENLVQMQHYEGFPYAQKNEVFSLSRGCRNGLGFLIDLVNGPGFLGVLHSSLFIIAA